MTNRVLLTGSNGFLGAQIARRLIEDPDTVILALVRSQDHLSAADRLRRAWSDWPKLLKTIGTRVEVLDGDVSRPQFGLDPAQYSDLVCQVTHIIHSAADMRVTGPIEELRKTNLGGVATILELARAVHRDHGLVRLAHVSTAYVAGGRSGPVPEGALTDRFGFSSAYEQSKYEGELLVQAAKAELPISVFRPGMIVGDSHDGAIKTFNTFYFPLRLYLTGQLRILPANPRLRVNLVPVDYVAEAITRLTFEPRAAGLNFHVTAPYELLPTARELADYARDWAREHLGARLPRALLVPLPESWIRGRYHPQAPARGRGGRFDAVAGLAPYFNERIRFERDNMDRLLGPFTLHWREFMPALLEYATYRGFMHRSDRTVHEQILFRLEHSSLPVTYHDIADGRVSTRSADEVRQEMITAAGAVRALGIERGDRVAMVGLNSTRYLTLDVAIGLAGAVSVPLYYTSPPSDIDWILQASGAKILFVGVPKLLERLDELKTTLPIVSFCRQPVPGQASSRVQTWDAFLALGSGQPATRTAPVGLGDPATLRYTSGTTGRPKGVTFSHENLRWTGECLASLMPWRTRTHHANYLSCLPMNHVVEGILATYSPYYIPAPLDIYFLQDLHQLQFALARVHPSVFFSVPRVYEKFWEALEKSRPGRLYLSTRHVTIRRMLRPLLRSQMLSKAGLDRCGQMIVGSAPCGPEFLTKFRELGIELHNAYGMTEAPLVTLNRLGANRIGTVGEPLPETEIRVAEDGEVMVRGPQVMMGYYGEGVEQPFENGWLLTGDLGHLTEEGRVVISGRKKEIIATAYGKKICPARVETLLREIPGVDEAMLVGEARPYCIGLLWVKPSYGNGTSAEAIDRAVAGVNARVSHPEQVKRWALLPNDLSVEGGTFTPNLKLKRAVAAARCERIIENLYEGAGPMPGVLHTSTAERG